MQKRPKRGRRTRSSPGPDRGASGARPQSRTPPPKQEDAGNRLLLHNFGKEPADDSELSDDVRALVERLAQEQQASIQQHENSRVQIEAMAAQLHTLFQDAVKHLETQTEERVANELSDQETLVERRLQQFSARLDALHEKVESLRYRPERRPEPPDELMSQPRSRRLELSVGFIVVSGLVLLASFIAVSLALNAYTSAGG